MPGHLAAMAYAEDPIACWAVFIATAIVIGAILFRGGGIDARFIIQVFSTMATVGTVGKVAIWGLATLLSSRTPPAPPSGTDGVLVAGALFAIVVSSYQDVVAAFGTDGKQPSRAARFARRWFRDRFPDLGDETSGTAAARETKEATAVREGKDPAAVREPPRAQTEQGEAVPTAASSSPTRAAEP